MARELPVGRSGSSLLLRRILLASLLQFSHEMNFSFAQLSWRFGACLNCGSLLLYQHPVCSFCYEISCGDSNRQRPFFEMAVLPRSQRPISLTWMVSWTNQSEAWMSRWARLLKGSGHNGAWSFYAEDFAAKWGEELLACDDGLRPLIVVTPSLKTDHASLFGQAFSREMGCRFLEFPWSEKVSDSAQKTKSRLQRQELKFLSKHEAKDFVRKQKNQLNWVFMDDVWTTGTTAEAIYDALGKPRFFRALTFFRRLR